MNRGVSAAFVNDWIVRRRRQCRGLPLLQLILLAGCATYQPRPLSPADAESAFVARTLDAPALRQFVSRHGAPELGVQWPPLSWDLRLLTLAAFFYHADLEVARAKLASAEAALISAGARPNPAASLSPTYDADPVGGVSPWTLGFSLELPIETAGKRDYRIAQAQHSANSARLNLANAAWHVRSRVRKSLAELQGATSVQDILARQRAVQDQTVGLLEARWRAGENSLTEVQLVRVAAAQTALDLDEARKQSTQARIGLADALGVPAEALAPIGLSFSDLDVLPAADQAGALRREALLNRPDVLGVLADYEASQSALRLEVARQYPDIHLGPGYAWDQGENKFTLGVSLTLPVFNRNRGPIAEAEARRREAAAAFDALQARAIGEVELAFAGYRDALRKLETADALLARQQQRLTSAQESFAAGAIDRVELLQAQLEFGSGERARAAAFAEAQLALGALEDATQRPAGADRASGVPESLLNGKSE
jgi:cobalt-zinc-cadmium efflux system outer membrane protein